MDYIPYAMLPPGSEDASETTGFAVETLRMLARNLNFTFDLVMAEHKVFGTRERASGRYSGILGK